MSKERIDWTPVEDLPSHWASMSSTELAHLATIWSEQAERLADSAAVREFHQRMAREWAIETGIIEGLYTLDRGTTQLLIERGIEASLIAHDASNQSPETLAAILKVQQDALEGVFQFVNQNRELSKTYVRQLHQVMTRHQVKVEGLDHLGNYVETDLIRGDWKKLPNNPMREDAVIHEYCPPEHVESEMDQLLQWHQEHIATGVPAEVEAAWLHHRFTQIHPFQDGNGRIARSLASLVFLRGRCFPLSIHRDDRADYIDALEAADSGDLSELIQLFVRIQRTAFLKALSISESVLQTSSRADVIAAAVAKLSKRTQDREARSATNAFTPEGAAQLAIQLADVAYSDLEATTSDLHAALRAVDARYSATLTRSSSESAHWFKPQIARVAQQFNYSANVANYAGWVRLKLASNREASIVVSWHSIGTTFNGVLGVTCFLQFRDRDEANRFTEGDPLPCCDKPFVFSFLDESAPLQQRFKHWFDECLLMALEQWRRQL